MVNVALFVRLEAKPGKEADIESLLRGGLLLVQDEPATTAWFAIQLGPSTFGIFDAFPNDAQVQVRVQLSQTLVAVVCLRLLARLNGPGRRANSRNPRNTIGAKATAASPGTSPKYHAPATTAHKSASPSRKKSPMLNSSERVVARELWIRT